MVNDIVEALRSAQQKQLTAYERGYSSGKNDRYSNIFDCPYSSIEHSHDYQDWMRGFADGRRDGYTGGQL